MIDEFSADGMIDYFNQTAIGINYYLLIKGKHFGTPKDNIIAVTAQYDTFGNAGGVDNNGSGTSALLEIMRLILSFECDLEFSILLVANDFEEYGQIGINHFMNNYLVPELLNNGKPYSPKFQGAIVLETMMNWNDTENSQEVPIPDPIFEYLWSEEFKWFGQNKRRGNFALVLGRTEPDDHLHKTFFNTWCQENNDKYKILRLTLNITAGPLNVSEDIAEMLKQFYQADLREFYLYNGPVIMRAIMITDSGKSNEHIWKQ